VLKPCDDRRASIYYGARGFRAIYATIVPILAGDRSLRDDEDEVPDNLN
jgi:hypothetical protein